MQAGIPERKNRGGRPAAQISEKLEIYKTSSFQTARNIDGNYAQKATIDIKDRAERMADEFYDLILRFKISSNKKESTDTLAHKERRENKSSAKETIGTLIQNARKSNSENSEPDFQQLSLFWLLLAWSGYLHLSRKRHFVPSFFDFKILALCKPDWMFSEGKSY